MRNFLVAIAIALMASGCVSSTESVVRDRLVYPAIPAEARRPCPAPVDLPDTGGLTAARTTALWAADRTALVTCERRRALAVQAATEPGR